MRRKTAVLLAVLSTVYVVCMVGLMQYGLSTNVTATPAGSKERLVLGVQGFAVSLATVCLAGLIMLREMW